MDGFSPASRILYTTWNMCLSFQYLRDLDFIRLKSTLMNIFHSLDNFKRKTKGFPGNSVQKAHYETCIHGRKRLTIELLNHALNEPFGFRLLAKSLDFI